VWADLDADELPAARPHPRGSVLLEARVVAIDDGGRDHGGGVAWQVRDDESARFNGHSDSLFFHLSPSSPPSSPPSFSLLLCVFIPY
jgi:hypothetical protein